MSAKIVFDGFRQQSIRNLAISTTIACVIMGSLQVWFFFKKPEHASLWALSLWFACAGCSALVQWRLHAHNIQLTSFILLLTSTFGSIALGLVEQSTVALLVLGLGSPILIIGLLTAGLLHKHNNWFYGLPLLFIVAMVLRYWLNPIPFISEVDELISVLLMGSLSLLLIAHNSRFIFRMTHQAFLEGEEIRHALEQANEGLQKARDAALAATKAKSTFLATMSHELRTPLNAIIGYTELMLEDLSLQQEESQELTPDLRRIDTAAKHLLTLISDILDLSKIEAGRMDLYIDTISITEMVHMVVSTVKPMLEQHQTQLHLEVEEDIGVMRADHTKLRQILLNLLSNAAKFTSQGKVALTVKSQSSETDGDGIQFTISDTGIGIDTDKIKQLFDPFMQADDSTTRKYGGTGLGLTITKHFCEMMRGTIQVCSTPGKGSQFDVWIPRYVLTTEASSSRSELELPPGMSLQTSLHPHSNGKPRDLVLVVDDDTQTRKMIQRMLNREGFTVRFATSGPEALALAREIEPIAITLDVLMPEMNGWEVLKELKKTPETAHIPVVMLTMVDKQKIGFSLGAAEYLTKPIERSTLLQTLNRFRRQHMKTRTLVIDDDANVRQMTRRILEREGWDVDEAMNGKQALEQLQVAKPQVILLDLMMPEVDGFQVLEALRANKDLARIPVVVLTGKELSQEERTALLGKIPMIHKQNHPELQLLRDLRTAIEQSVLSKQEQHKNINSLSA